MKRRFTWSWSRGVSPAWPLCSDKRPAAPVRAGSGQVEIRIKLYGVFRIDRFKEAVRDCPPGTTVREVVERTEFPAICSESC
jgi:hypothetical protein